MTADTDILELLFRAARGETTAAERRKVTALLRRDPELAGLYDTLRELHQAGDSLPEPELQAAVDALATRMLREHRRGSRSRRKQVGLTLFDSHDLPLPQGVRPASVDTRRLRFRVGDREVAIAIHPTSAEEREILGQVSGRPDTGTYRVTLRCGRKEHRTESDRHGVFRFSGHYSGPVTLTFTTEGEPPGEIRFEI